MPARFPLTIGESSLLTPDENGRFVPGLFSSKSRSISKRDIRFLGEIGCLFPGYFVPNPSLAQQDNLLELLFERMPMGIAILDQEFRIQRYNPTWKEFAVQYAPPGGAPLVPGVGYFDHLPGSEVVVQPLFKRALAGGVAGNVGA